MLVVLFVFMRQLVKLYVVLRWYENTDIFRNFTYVAIIRTRQLCNWVEGHVNI
jgi:hypothetical protein